MTGVKFVGVDPDSKGCEFYLLGGARDESRRFGMDYASMKDCIRWLKKTGNVVVGIEGKGNYSRPLEEALDSEGIRYENFSADKLYHFRQSMIGANKSNRNDAMAAALFLKNLYENMPDEPERLISLESDLRELTREIARKSKQATFLTNRLWKQLRRASQDLYMWLSGSDEDSGGEKRADKLCILRLIAARPDVSGWKTLTEAEFLEAAESRKTKNWQVILEGLRKSTAHAVPAKALQKILLKQTAEELLSLKKQMSELEKALEEVAQDYPDVLRISANRGIGIRLASAFVAEIADIRRFANDDKLASYAGFGRREYSTGDTKRMIRSRKFNHYLKDSVMQMSLRYVQWNPDSVLGRYCHALIKKGMKKMEAYRRVGRALIRQFYREMKSMAAEKEKGKETMASRPSGNDLNDQVSNMAPSRLSVQVRPKYSRTARKMQENYA